MSRLIELERSAVHLLDRAGQRTHDLFAATVAGENLTSRQLAVLEAISAIDGASQTDIVRVTGIDRSTLADTCCVTNCRTAAKKRPWSCGAVVGRQGCWARFPFSKPRPLYGLDMIRDAKQVIVVEGEKCRNALAKATGRTVVSWPGGTLRESSMPTGLHLPTAKS